MQLDRWGMRQAEKRLAGELHLARAEYRLAVFHAIAAETLDARSKLRSAEMEWFAFLRSGVPTPDSANTV